jgi:hypothetical protein
MLYSKRRRAAIVLPCVFYYGSESIALLYFARHKTIAP